MNVRHSQHCNPTPHRRTSARERIDQTAYELLISGVTTQTIGRQTRAALLDSQRRVLERIASGAPLQEILETLVRPVEEQADGMRCAVLLTDTVQHRLKFVTAPNIPEDYRAGIKPFPRIAPDMGAFGTAAFLREPVYTKDAGIDAPWEDCPRLSLRVVNT